MTLSLVYAHTPADTAVSRYDLTYEQVSVILAMTDPRPGDTVSVGARNLDGWSTRHLGIARYLGTGSNGNPTWFSVIAEPPRDDLRDYAYGVESHPDAFAALGRVLTASPYLPLDLYA